jgi:hypothetical protein
MVALLPAALAACAPARQIEREAAGPAEVVGAVCDAIERDAALWDDPCEGLVVLPLDGCGAGEDPLRRLHLEIGSELRRRGLRAFRFPSPAGGARVLRLLSERRPDALAVRLVAQDGDEVVRVRLPGTPDPGVADRVCAGRVGVGGPWFAWDVLDLLGADARRLIVLTADAVHLAEVEIDDGTIAVRLLDAAALASYRSRRPAVAFGFLAAPDPRVDRAELLARVHAPWLVASLDVLSDDRRTPHACRVVPDTTAGVRLGNLPGRFAADGVGVLLQGGLLDLEAAPFVDLLPIGHADGAYLALDRDGYVHYGTADAAWGPPLGGCGPAVVPLDDGWLTATAASPPAHDALVKLTIDRHRTLVVRWRTDLGSCPVTGLAAADFDGDDVDDIVVARESAGGTQLSFFMSNVESFP